MNALQATVLKGVHGEPAVLEEVRAEASIDDLLAEVEITHRYRNPEPTHIEAVYTFPLPPDGVLLGFEVEIGDRKLAGSVVEKSETERQDEDAIIDCSNAVLLEQAEPDLYTANLGNLRPGESAKIHLRYGLLLRWTGDHARFTMPTTIAPRCGDPASAGLAPRQVPECAFDAASAFSVRVVVRGLLEDACFSSPSHDASFTPGAKETVVRLAGTPAMDRDFILEACVSRPQAAGALVARDFNGWMALASFRPETPATGHRQRRCIKIVVDCSGSMGGDSIAQARMALARILDSLHAGDLFEIIAFGGSQRALFGREELVSETTLAQARRFARTLDADMRGTQIGAALDVAYAVRDGSGLLRDLLLITDGKVVWNSSEVITRACRSRHRIFTVGVGSAVAKAFVRRLAKATGGACELVHPREDMADLIHRHFQRMYAPRVRKAVVRWPIPPKASVSRDTVYGGDTVHVFAWFARKPEGKASLEVTLADGRVVSQGARILAVEEGEAESPPSEEALPSTLGRIGTARRIAAMDDRQGDRQAGWVLSTMSDCQVGTQLAIRYQLMSRWTNYIVSATELSVLRARIDGGRRSKAQRGEHCSSPPVGFVREGNGLRKDPDLRVQAAFEAVFAHFREGGSGLQATHLLREAGVQLPSRPHGPHRATWREATYSRVMDILKNPAMGGAYAYGKPRHAYRDDGRLLAPEERWRGLKPGRHDGYVSWPQWLEVQETLAANSTERDRNRGAAREGAALLEGLAVCGHCGRSLLVRYNKGPSYCCNQRTPDLGQRRSCFSAGGIEIDRVVARRFMNLVSPGGVGAARAAAQAITERAEAALRSQRLELEQCRYEAGLAERRYRQAGPDNRLIAATLEREWEAALKAVESAQFALETARERRPDLPPPSFFAGLGGSLERVWNAPQTTHRDRKRLLACLVEEVALQVDGEGRTEVVIHWRGGRTDAFSVKRQPRRPVRGRDDIETVELVRRLARFYPDGQIAGILNDQGRRSAQGLAFSTSLVQKLRYRHGVPRYRAAADEEEGELLSVRAAARQLGISDSTLYRWLNSGVLPSVRPDMPGARVRIRMDAGFRSRFHLDPPEGFVPLQEAMRRLGVSRQTIWQRAASGQLDSCHVKRGAVRGLYVRLETDELPVFEGTLPAQQEHGDA